MVPGNRDHADPDDQVVFTTCPNCFGSRFVPDIFGEYVLCDKCSVIPRDPLWL